VANPSNRPAHIPKFGTVPGAAGFGLLVFFMLAVAISFDTPQRGFESAASVLHSMRNPGSRGTPCSLFLAQVALAPVVSGRRYRVVIYARYSTDDQNPRSIDDQIARCREFINGLALGDLEVIIITDGGISGRKKFRPGIDRVRQIIAAKDCDLVVAVDQTRFFRRTVFWLEFGAFAHDSDVRVVTANDGLDTKDDRWRIVAPINAIVGEFMVQQCSARIRGSVDNRWREGYAVSPLVPGYIRVPSNPNAEDPKRRGPYRDKIVEKWKPAIQEAFRRIARDESSGATAEFLNESGVPLAYKSRLNLWTLHHVRRMVKNPLYSGKEVYRLTLSRAIETTGETRQVQAPADKILRRDMPHLAIVDESLWRKANDALLKHHALSKYRKGAEHPYFGVPRDRWGPLSMHFLCEICGSRMYKNGPGYQCSASKVMRTLGRKNGKRCWNRCNPLVRVVHAKIGGAIVDQLLRLLPNYDVVYERCMNLIKEGDGVARRRLEHLHRTEADLQHRISGINDAIEKSGGQPSLLERLKSLEAELAVCQADSRELTSSPTPAVPLPSREEIRARIEELKPMLFDSMERKAGPIIRLLTSPIRAVPYKAFDSQRIIVRGHFDLDLLALVPNCWRDLLTGGVQPEQAAEIAKLTTTPMVVDLFERPAYLVNAQQVFELKQGGLTNKQIMARLNISWDAVKAAYKAALRMKELGLSDPYLRLTEPTLMPGRWSRAKGYRSAQMPRSHDETAA
jgi:DNA invertase Pin-like site-specific DNA recombinase